MKNRLLKWSLALGLFALLTPITLSAQTSDWRRDSIYLDQGIPETTDFENQIRVYFEAYDTEGRPLEIIAQKQNAQEEWANWRRRTFTYTNDDLTELLIQFWNPSQETWQDAKQRQYVYDGDGNLTSRQINKASGPGTPLENHRRWTYTLNGNGEQTELLFQKWDGSAWENVSQQEWSYDMNGRVSQQVQHLWDGNDWTNGRRRIWVYDGVTGIVEQVIAQYWYPDTGDWLNSDQVMYENDGTAFITGIRMQEWEIPIGWKNIKQELFSYSGGQLQFKKLMQWDGSNWIDQFRLNYQYDGTTLNAIGDEWNANQNNWDTYVRYQLVFDSGRPQVEQGWQFWNPDQEEWENENITFRRRHFWTDLSVGTNSIPEFTACTVPNPFPVGATFSCSSLKDGQTYRVSLSNLAGQEVATQLISGPGPHYLHTAGLSGFHVLSISQGNQLVFVQKLIIAE